MSARPTTGSKAHTLDGVTRATPVELLQYLIAAKEGTAVVRLVFEGKPLQAGTTVGSYGVKKGSTVHAMFSLPGGMQVRAPPSLAHNTLHTLATPWRHLLAQKGVALNALNSTSRRVD